MIDAGVNVFRVNFSHADYEDVKRKSLESMMNTVTLQHGDLQGPKLRVGYEWRCQ
jgi:pyruvate kinase